MSLSASAGGLGSGAGALSAGWTPPPMAQQHQHQQSSSHEHSAGGGCCDGPALPSLLEPTPGHVSRGEIVNDECVTVDIFAAGGVAAAAWSEKKGRLVGGIDTYGLKPIVHLSEETVSELEEKRLAGELELDSLFKTAHTDQLQFGAPAAAVTGMTAFFPARTLAGGDGSDISPSDLNAAGLLLLKGVEACQGAAGAAEGAAGPEKKKKKKGKRIKRSITLVAPCGYSQLRTQALIDAATERARLTVRNVFNRGVAAVTGALYRDAAGRAARKQQAGQMGHKQTRNAVLNLDEELHGIMSQRKGGGGSGSSAVVFYFNVAYSLAGTASQMMDSHFDADSSPGLLTFDAALVSCEGVTDSNADSSGRSSNLLGFDRLCTLATAGGSVAEYLRALDYAEKSTGGAGVDGEEQRAAGVLAQVAKKPADVSASLQQLSVQVCGALLESLAGTRGGGGNGDAAVEVCAVVLDGLVAGRGLFASPGFSSAAKLQFHQSAAGESPFKAVPALYSCQSGDAAAGGALLSAAELDSSKEYVQAEDGTCRIGYMLPIADGVLMAGDLGMRTFWSPEEKAEAEGRAVAESEVEVLFRCGTRIVKAESGPGLQSLPENVVLRKEYDWGSTYLRSRCFERGSGQGCRSAAVRTVGFPHVQILQRRPVGSSSGSDAKAGDWQLVTEAQPLARPVVTKKAGDTIDAVRSAAVNIQLSAATGMLSVGMTQSRTVRQIQRDHFGWVKLVAVVAVPLLLYLGYVLTGTLAERSKHAEHVQWLTEFYELHAPEKLAGVNGTGYVERTLKRYEKDGKMFLLWRALEKQYNTKYRPPASILDDESSTSASAAAAAANVASSSGSAETESEF